MLGLFYQYLIHHHKIVLPGLGAVVLQRNPSVSNFTEHEFLPPSYAFKWDKTITNPSPDFFVWLSGKLNVPEEDAAMQVNDFVAELKREINAGKEISWEGVGTIRRGSDSGGIELEPADSTGFSFDKKVHGEKVIHEDSSHTILVGDEEKTSTEMTEILNLPERKKFTWWHAALVIGAIALIFIIIYMSVNGWTTGSVSNKNKMTPQDAPASYK